MSKQRQREREARQAARRAEVEAAARARERKAKRTAVVERLTPSKPKRQRRYGALSTAARLRLLLMFLVIQVAIWLLFPGYGPRAAFAILTIASLAVTVRTRRRTPR